MVVAEACPLALSLSSAGGDFRRGGSGDSRLLDRPRSEEELVGSGFWDWEADLGEVLDFLGVGKESSSSDSSDEV